jgi:hypothetical protein
MLVECLRPSLARRPNVVVRGRDLKRSGTLSWNHECEGTQSSDKVMISMFRDAQYNIGGGILLVRSEVSLFSRFVSL